MWSARTVGRLAIAASASVPGLYAWGVTVVPVVWGRPHVPVLANLGAILGPVILGFGAGFDRRLGGGLRSACLGAFTLACALSWASAAAPGDVLLDTTHAVAGVLAWGVFALSWAAPPLEVLRDGPRVVRRVLPGGADTFPSGAFVNAAFGIAAALGLQFVALETKTPERSLLIRLGLVAGALAAAGAGAKIAVARLGRRKR